MKNLSKEEFWNDVEKKFPDAAAIFYGWVDLYKKEVGWDLLFVPGVKFHDLPLEMQNGIIARFELEMYNNKFGDGKVRAREIMEAYIPKIIGLFEDLQNNLTQRSERLN